MWLETLIKLGHLESLRIEVIKISKIVWNNERNIFMIFDLITVAATYCNHG